MYISGMMYSDSKLCKSIILVISVHLQNLFVSNRNTPHTTLVRNEQIERQMFFQNWYVSVLNNDCSSEYCCLLNDISHWWFKSRGNHPEMPVNINQYWAVIGAFNNRNLITNKKKFWQTVLVWESIFYLFQPLSDGFLFFFFSSCL